MVVQIRGDAAQERRRLVQLAIEDVDQVAVGHRAVSANSTRRARPLPGARRSVAVAVIGFVSRGGIGRSRRAPKLTRSVSSSRRGIRGDSDLPCSGRPCLLNTKITKGHEGQEELHSCSSCPSWLLRDLRVHAVAVHRRTHGSQGERADGERAERRTFTGTAKKRKPRSGTPSSPRMCSQMGMSARRSVLCTGRARSSVSSMLSVSMPTKTAPSSRRCSAAARVRTGWPLEVRVRAPVRRVAGVDQHRTPLTSMPANAFGRWPGRTRSVARTTTRVEVGQRLQRQLGEVLPVCIAMERAVHVGAGVRDHVDPADVELRPWRIQRARRLAAQEVADDRRGIPLQRHHPVRDRVAEVDQPPALSRIGLHHPAIVFRWINCGWRMIPIGIPRSHAATGSGAMPPTDDDDARPRPTASARPLATRHSAPDAMKAAR